MRRTSSLHRLIHVVAVATMAGALPAAARAQVYPERLHLAERHRTVAYQQRDEREEQTERTTKTLRLGANGQLDLSNIAGDITITAGGGSDATIEIVKTARARTADEAREMLQLVQVDVAERSGRGEVRARYPRGDERRGRRNINVSIDYTVTAPAGTAITAKSVSGEVSAKGIKGELSLESVSGDIRIESAARVARAKSVSGSVDIADATLDGSLEASSVSGDVILRRVNARRVDAESVSGSVEMTDVRCSSVDASSVSGNMKYSGALAENGRYELASHSGEIRVIVDGSIGFELDASSFSGSVRSDLPITTHGDEDGGRRRRRSLSGTFGNGSAVLDLSTFSGNIVIAKR